MYATSELMRKREEERERFRETVERRLKNQQGAKNPKKRSEIEEEILRRRKETGYIGGDN